MTVETPLRPAHPLAPWEPALAELTRALSSGAGVELEIGTHDTGAVTNLRLDPDGPARAVAEALLAAPIPTRPGTWTATGDGEIVWLGPDEWLVTSRDTRPQAGETRLRAALGEHGGSAVEVTGQRAGLRIRGRLSRELLAFGCALDLHPRVFPAGRCAQTLLGRAGVILVALGDGDDFLVHVRSSFAGYLADWLLDAAEEFRPASSPSKPPTTAGAATHRRTGDPS